MIVRVQGTQYNDSVSVSSLVEVLYGKLPCKTYDLLLLEMLKRHSSLKHPATAAIQTVIEDLESSLKGINTTA